MTIEQVKNIEHVFILARARSGSTLLTTMLNAHPNIIATIEEPFAYYLYPKYKKVSVWTSDTIQTYCYDFFLFSEGKLEIQFGTKKDLETILEEHKNILTAELAIKLSYLCFYPHKNKNNIKAIADKELLFHFHTCLSDVAAFYPKSKFIILSRDPRDNNLFIMNYNIAKKKEWWLNKKNALIKLGYSYNNNYTKLDSLKNKIGTQRFLNVKYEDIIQNTKAELKKITDFIEIPFDNQMLSYYENTHQKQKDISKNTRETLTKFHNGLTQKISTKKINIYINQPKEYADLTWTLCWNISKKIGYKEDENFTQQPKSLRIRCMFLYYIIIIKFYSSLWYALPFQIQRFIKKIRYTNFKQTPLTGQEYYQKSYYEKNIS